VLPDGLCWFGLLALHLKNSKREVFLTLIFRYNLSQKVQFAGPAPRALPTKDFSTKRGEVMLSQETTAQIPQIQTWRVDRLIFYARNPRKNDAAVDRMCGSIREFGFKISVLARSDGEVVDGHLRLKAARK
jgi:hypothetical protein